jgi:Polyketide cyclase / dehydrase and lipid transport
VNSRRVLIAIGLLAVVYNCMRAFHRWRLAPAFGAGFVVQFLGLVTVLSFAVLIAHSAWRRDEFLPMLPAALWGAASGAVVGLFATFISTLNEQTYGLALFILAPVLVGFHSAFALASRERTRVRDAVIVSMFAIILLGTLLIGFALEGAICLLMALPIAIPLAIVGALLGYGLRKHALAHQPTVLLVFIGLTPFSATVEHALPRKADIVQVATSIDIAASPEQVWRTILQPAHLAAPSDLLFRAGVGYPLASHIEGEGASAIRYCDFSTGKLVEPVLIWDEGRRLRFTVRSNPLPMQEWTPYARLHPPHLDGFLVSRQGEFQLEALPNGHTRLIATTWYQDHLYPAPYWKLWSDYIIHQVHDMVLENVRERALAGLQKDSSFEKAHGLPANGYSLAAILQP